MTDNRTCDSCKGSGQYIREAFSYEGKDYPRYVRACLSCNGAGTLPTPDVQSIIKAIKGRKGLCSKRPKDGRAYYVWRMARFHGGADVTMPIGAMTEIHGDPWRPELDKIADRVARKVFGSDLAAAHRWGRALGHIDRDMPGLPDSAYMGGRVADADKPLEEALELL